MHTRIQCNLTGPYTDDYGLVQAVLQTIQMSVVTIYALSAMLMYVDAAVMTK